MPKGWSREVEAPPQPGSAVRRTPGEDAADAETSDWFLRLPPAAQEEYRARWAADDARDVKREKFAKDTLKRSIAQGACLFLVVETIGAMPSIGHSLAAIPTGAAVGAYWNRVGAGRFRCMTSSAVPYAVLRIVFADVSSTYALILTCIYAVVGFVLLISLAALVGFVRERRVADNEDH